jgi:hypothetical protein
MVLFLEWLKILSGADIIGKTIFVLAEVDLLSQYSGHEKN